MKPKILLVMLSILLVGTAISQEEKVTVQMNAEEFVPPEQLVNDQSARQKFPFCGLGAYPDVNGYVDHVFTRGESSQLKNVLAYYCDKGGNVKFHVLITGPNFEKYHSGSYSVNKNTSYTWWIRWNMTWPAGVYRVTFVIQAPGKAGGLTLVVGYGFIVY